MKATLQQVQSFESNDLKELTKNLNDFIENNEGGNKKLKVISISHSISHLIGDQPVYSAIVLFRYQWSDTWRNEDEIRTDV